MNKYEFMAAVREKLGDVPREDIERSLDYYAEMIDDRIEEGFSEEEAVAAMGSPDDVAAQILGENLHGSQRVESKVVAENVSRRRALRGWEIALLILGSPLWLPLLLAAVIIILAVYIVMWSAVVVLYSADLCLAAGAVAGIFMTFVLPITGNWALSVMSLGAALVCAGFAIFAFLGCNAVAKGMILLTKKIFIGVKNLIIGKGEGK